MYMPSLNLQLMESFKPSTSPYFTPIINTRSFPRQQCECQRLTPPMPSHLVGTHWSSTWPQGSSHTHEAFRQWQDPFRIC